MFMLFYLYYFSFIIVVLGPLYGLHLNYNYKIKLELFTKSNFNEVEFT